MLAETLSTKAGGKPLGPTTLYQVAAAKPGSSVDIGTMPGIAKSGVALPGCPTTRMISNRSRSSHRLASLQRDVCRDLLLEEIRAFRPKRLVLATGFSWAEPFLDLPCFHMGDKPAGPLAHRKGRLILDDEEIGRFVAADHPQGKNEDRWLAEVLAAFS